MQIFLTNETNKCEFCGKEHKNVRALSQHLKTHKITSRDYTVKILLKNETPLCKCGCGRPVTIKNFKYEEYVQGHNPNCFWQNTLDKDSEEYKAIVEKISKTVGEYQRNNPKIVSDEVRKKLSDKMKETMSDPEEKARRFEKMKNTKRIQSEDGTLSNNHWTKKLTDEELDAKLFEIVEKSKETKRINKENGREYIPWNKNETKKTDQRIKKTSDENNYRYNGNGPHRYSRKFYNKEFRRLILESQNSLCFNCNNPEMTSLCLHHIDEDKHNNEFDNLIFVCRSCHIRIHNSETIRNIFNEKVFEFKLNFKKEQ